MTFISRNSQNAVAIAVVLNLLMMGYFAVYLTNYGYLPAPFIFDKSNTFMDFFNPLYWAFNSGRYTEWGSVYPPLNFWILRIGALFFNFSEFDSPEQLRDNFEVFAYIFGLIYIFNAYLLAKCVSLRPVNAVENAIFFLLIAFSPPMLFAFERGNLILLCPILIAVLIAYDGIFAVLALAVLINLKPYLALLLFAYVLKSNYMQIIKVAFIAGLIFCISGIVLDDEFLKFFDNIVGFSGNDGLFSRLELIAFPPNLSPFMLLLQRGELNELIPAAYTMVALYGLAFLKFFLLGAAINFCIRYRTIINFQESLFFVMVVLLNLGTFVGGYSLILYFPFIAIFPGLILSNVFFLCLLGLCLPWDFMSFMTADIGRQVSFLGHVETDVIWTLSLGVFVRPVISTVLLALIPIEIVMRNISYAGKRLVIPT